MKGSGIPSRTSRHLLRASSNATAKNTVNFDEDSTFDMDPVSIDKSMSMPMWQPNDSIFRPSKSGKGSKATGSPTPAPSVSVFDWIGYEGLECSYYFYDILSHAIHYSSSLSFYRLLIGALIHNFPHSPKD